MGAVGGVIDLVVGVCALVGCVCALVAGVCELVAGVYVGDPACVDRKACSPPPLRRAFTLEEQGSALSGP